MSDIVGKIRKLMELAGNNPNAHEAEAAALKAQRLMVENGITELGESKEEVASVILKMNGARYWRFLLAVSIASSFRCRVVMRGNDIQLFGIKTDTEICSEVFKNLYQIGHKLGLNTVKSYKNRYPYKSATGVYGQFVSGFSSGVRNQLTIQSKALMVVVPKNVEEHVNEIAGSKRTLRKQQSMVEYNKEEAYRVWQRGFETGKNSVSTALQRA